MRPAPPAAEQARDLLAVLCVAGLGAFLVLFPLNRPDDPDVWFHLASGRQLWASGEYPQMGRFLWTWPEGAPGAHHAWLFQALLYPLHAAAGVPGLVVAKCLLVALTFGLLFAREVTRPTFVPLTLALLTAYGGASGRFLIRPEVPSALLLALEWLLLEGRLTRRRLVALVALQVLWVNLHWSAILGVALAACAAAADLLPRRLRLPAGWEPLRLHPDARRVAALPAVLAAATLANPDFAQPFVEPFRYFFPRGFTLQLGELGGSVGALLTPGVPAHVAWYFATLALAALALALALARRRLALFHAAALVAFAVLSLSALRHLLFFCAVAVPVIGRALRPAPGESRPPAPWREAGGSLLVLVLLSTLLINRVTGVDFAVPYPRPHEPFSLAASPVLWPYDAARFVEEARLPERLFNDFNSGNFLAWALPGRRLYINGTLADPATEREYVSVTRDPGRWEPFARERGVNAAFFRLMPVVANGPLLGTLLASPAWRLAFYDGTAAVFVRAAVGGVGGSGGPPAVDLAKELRAAIRSANAYACQADLLSWVPLWREISGLRRRLDLARVYRARARFYLLAGREDLAAAAQEFALELEGLRPGTGLFVGGQN